MKLRNTSIGYFLLFSIVGVLSSAAAEPDASSIGGEFGDGPLEPEAALSAFRLEPGLRIEIAAAEPLVADPVAIAFDEQGRMYVAENRGYPTGPGPDSAPVGTIALLEDVDRDGRYEKRTTFADGLTFPNGLMPWKGGVLVTCAPDIIHLRDNDGDGRADERRVLFTGFDAGNTSQLRMSHPTLGVDNWIYVTSGLTGGNITSPDHSDRTALQVKSDFRFHPVTGAYEAADGRGQFGLSFDDSGHRFVCYNRVQVQHVVLPSRYLRRNQHLAFSDTVQNAPETLSPEPLRGHGAAARIFPISRNVTTADSHAGTFTAACGLLIYRGTALPAEYFGNAMACEPTGNLVHRDRLVPSGATFVARAGRDGMEMVASTDNWFRPVNLAIGPDGALYICDMYRKTIEHPQYLPVEIRKRTDFSSGNDRGRIYRLRAERGIEGQRDGSANTEVAWSDATLDEICGLMDEPNAFWRETGQRMILERQDKAAVSLLEARVKNQNASVPVSRLHALGGLAALGAVSDEVLALTLKDSLPAVREYALQLAEEHLRNANTTERWRPRVERLASDPDARVRFQCALTLGESMQPNSRLLAGIALAQPGDRWTRAAVFSSVSQPDEFFQELIESLENRGRPFLDGPEFANVGMLLAEAGRLLGAAVPAEKVARSVARMLTQAGGIHEDWQRSVVNGVKLALRSRGTSRGGSVLLQELAVADSAAANRIKILLSRSVAAATDRDRDLSSRLGAIEFLELAEFATAGPELLKLLRPETPVELQRAAVRSVVMMRDTPAGAMLLERERWLQYTPPVQESVTSVLLSSARHIEPVLDAVENGAIPHWAITAAQRNQLLKSKSEQIRVRAESLFKNRGNADRMKAFEQAKAALDLPTNPRTGQGVFKRHCANCHRLDREGVAVGPDLFSIRNQPKEAILLHTIVPEHEIVPGFGAYTVETKDGRSISGLIVSETPNSITLRAALGVEEVLLRGDIQSVTASELSLMPQGLETAMTHQELADLLAYLKGE